MRTFLIISILSAIIISCDKESIKGKDLKGTWIIQNSDILDTMSILSNTMEMLTSENHGGIHRYTELEKEAQSEKLCERCMCIKFAFIKKEVL